MIRIKTLIPALLLAVSVPAFVAACGDDDDDGQTDNVASTAPAGESPGGADGSWTGELETGVDVSLELWVGPEDPALEAVEAFREAAGAPPVLYGRATATNDSDAADTGRFVTLTGEDGDTFGASAIEVGFLCSRLNAWWREASEPTDELTRQYEELLLGLCNGNYLSGPTVAPGESATYFVAYEGDTPPQFERVFMGLGNELAQ